MVYVDPLTDVGFKIMFGPKTGKTNMLNILRALLRDLDISDIEYMDTEQTGFTPDEKRLAFDLSVRLTDGTRVIVEMQRENLLYFNYRSVFYSSHVIQAQASISREEQHEQRRRAGLHPVWNYHYSPVYLIGILEKGMGGEMPEQAEEHTDERSSGRYVERYRLLETTTGTDLNVDLNYIYLRLDRFGKDAQECTDMVDRFAYSLKNMKDLRDVPETFGGSPEMDHLYETGYLANLPVELRHEIETHKDMTTENDMLVAAEERGEARGKAEGKEETARSLKALGVDVEVICKATGLSREQVEAL